MKRISILLALFILGTAALKADPIKIHVSSIKEDRQVSNFNGVASSGNVNVIIKLGDTESLRLEGDAAAIADIITEVKGTVLNIRPKTKIFKNNIFRNSRVTAYITAKKLSTLVLSGSGDMTVENIINGKNLVTTLSGSGTIKTRAAVRSFVGVISGSGTINLSGNTEDANITLSGSGSFSGRDFSIEDLNTQLSGSGNVYVNVSKNINAAISGSGGVTYSGNATVQKRSVGSGRVRKV